MSHRLVHTIGVAALALVAALAVFSGSARAQAANDTSVVSPLRPNYGAYLVQTYPNPSLGGVPITIQWYNHNAETLSVKIYDLANRLMLVVQEKEMVDRGLHKYLLRPSRLPSGTYFIRLTTYTPSGAENTVDNSRFVIIH